MTHPKKSLYFKMLFLFSMYLSTVSYLNDHQKKVD